MSGEQAEKQRTAWVWPALAWSTITGVKARLNGTGPDAPTHAGDIELSHMSREFFGWWLEARGPRAMPEPDDVSPKALVELLPYFRMLRWESETSLVFRIYGSALVETTGFDLTGYCTFGEADYAGKADDIARLKLMHMQPCGLLTLRELRGPDGTPYLCEIINLPVSDGGDGKNRIVGTVVTRQAVEEADLDFKLSPPLTLRRAVFIDLGFGVPAAATGLSV
tara:strand:+ start:908 stop:1576 length:669 start_codon:yes stop_codon:yes gene_type:complete